MESEEVRVEVMPYFVTKGYERQEESSELRFVDYAPASSSGCALAMDYRTAAGFLISLAIQ